ncbi:MAG: phage tail sheath protein [Tissierellia bacterium]|nr:phage tail sheath protein [Tissierellia bacterium]
MPTIGMPRIAIEFKSAGLTAIQRSERGIALLILKDDTNKVQHSYTFTNLADVNEDDFTADNYKYIKLAFEGKPYKLMIENYSVTRNLATLLTDISTKKFNYFSMPVQEEGDKEKLISWHDDIRKRKDKTIKLVQYDAPEDNDHVLNWSTSEVKYKGVEYKENEFTPIISSLLAGLSLQRSSTYLVINGIESCSLEHAEDEDKAVNEGKLFLTFDGEKYKIARGVNSLVTYTQDQGEDFSKIRIIEGMDLVKDDIRDTFNDFYVGKILNTYANKQQFIALINRVYFKELENTVLEATANNYVDISMELNRKYAIKRGKNVDDMTDFQIKSYNTGSNVFLDGGLSFLDAMEDLVIRFNLD